MLVTALVQHIGNDNAIGIAKIVLKNRSALREKAVASGLVIAERFDAIVRRERIIWTR